MSGHVPGLVSTCFRSLGSASFLASEEWTLPDSGQPSSAVPEYIYTTLFGPFLPFQMAHLKLGSVH